MAFHFCKYVNFFQLHLTTFSNTTWNNWRKKIYKKGSAVSMAIGNCDFHCSCNSRQCPQLTILSLIKSYSPLPSSNVLAIFEELFGPHPTELKMHTLNSYSVNFSSPVTTVEKTNEPLIIETFFVSTQAASLIVCISNRLEPSFWYRSLKDIKFLSL